MSQSALIDPNSHRVDLENHTVTYRDQATGQLVKMDLGQADVHIDAALPFYASGYKLQDSFADKASPAVLVPKASDKYFEWDKDSTFRQVDSLVEGPGGTIPEVSPSLNSSSRYSTVQYVLGAFVPTEVEANADAPLRPKLKAMKKIMDAMRIAREQRVMTLLTTSGNWDSTVVTALGATANWNGGSTSDPIANIDAAMNASLQPITGMLMNRRTWGAFYRNPGVQKYISYKPGVPGTSPNPGDFTGNSGLLSLPQNIYVSDMKARGKTTGTYDYIWPDGTVVFLHELPAPPSDQESIATSYTFRWSPGSTAPDQASMLNDGSMMTNGWGVREYFANNRGARGGSMLVCTVNDAEVLTGNIVGGLLTGCYT